MVKQVAALRQSKTRRKEGLFVIDTARDIVRALQSPKAAVEKLCFCRDFPIPQELEAHLQDDRAVEFSQSAFEAMAYRQNPDGVIALAKTWNTQITDLKIENPTLVIVAESIEKPGNLGALLRIADAVGAQAIISCDEIVDLFNPNTIRASAGAIFNTPYAKGSFQEVMEHLRENNLKLIGTSPAANKNLWQADLGSPCAIAVGSEANGLSKTFLKHCSQLISIPMNGTGDSLNAGVATAITLYEALRQRQGK